MERHRFRLRPVHAVWAAGTALMVLGIFGANNNVNAVTRQSSGIETPQQENPVNIARETDDWKVLITLAGGLVLVLTGAFENPMRQEEVNPDFSLPLESPQPEKS